MVKKILVLATVVATALALSSTAFASALTCAHGRTCQPDGLGGPHTSGPGTLPFTGLDLVWIAAVGGLLLVSGLALRRMGRHRS